MCLYLGQCFHQVLPRACQIWLQRGERWLLVIIALSLAARSTWQKRCLLIPSINTVHKKVKMECACECRILDVTYVSLSFFSMPFTNKPCRCVFCGEAVRLCFSVLCFVVQKGIRLQNNRKCFVLELTL